MAARKFNLTKQELEALYTELGSTRKIATKIGVSKKLVMVYLKRFGIETRDPNRTTNEQMQAMAAMAADGKSAKEAAAAVGMHEVTVRRLARKHGFQFVDSYHKGFTITHAGYRQVWSKDQQCYVREHRLVVEQKLGRKLTDDDVVHHIDHDKLNNCHENLEVMSLSEHSKLHRAIQLEDIV